MGQREDVDEDNETAKKQKGNKLCRGARRLTDLVLGQSAWRHAWEEIWVRESD